MQNYTDLKTAVFDYAMRDDAPFDTLVRLFESDYAPQIIHFQAEKTTVLDIVAGRVTLPADFIKSRAIIVDGVVANPVSIFNSQVFPDTINYFQTGNQLVFTTGYADQPKKATIVYYGRITNVTSTAPTNWLLTNFPSVYLYGVLEKLYKWSIDAEAEAAAKTSLVESLQALGESHRNSTAVSNPPPAEVTQW
ncbi:phage adaptor protein [Agrobacterium sp. rho-8.1]|nr:hypothetical protein [Agrobacterium sp. rho-8.1]